MIKRLVLLLILLLVTISCGTNIEKTERHTGIGTGGLVLSLKWYTGDKAKAVIRRSPPAGVATIRITISGPGMTDIQQDFNAASPSGTINTVPAGVNRTINAQGLNAGGTVTHTGSISGLTINVGQTTDAGTITMNPAATYSVSGTVTLNGVGLAGVPIGIVSVRIPGGTSNTTITADDGTYTFAGVLNDNYVVWPFLTGYTFSPNISVTVNGANQTGQNFTATAVVVASTYYISGTIVDTNGAPLAGVAVALSGSNIVNTTTDSNGNYSFTGLANGSYTITPMQSNYYFSPINLTATVNGADATGENFTRSSISTASFTPLVDTGQTTVYATGDDASYTIDPPSYTDNGNGTITDNVTGLSWQKQDDATTRTWDAANTYCAGLSLAGTGWRVPTRRELMSIVDYGKYSPAINSTYFTSTRGDYYYWSSTTYARNTASAWLVDFYYGGVGVSGNKTYTFYVRCAR